MREEGRTKYSSTARSAGSPARRLLAQVLRDSHGTISPRQAAKSLSLSPARAKLLARWAQQGWVTRIHRGLYVPVPLESVGGDVPIEDSWIVAERLYSPCYIGGWSAAEHWGLTEQVFRTLLVMTTRKPRDRTPVVKDVQLQLRSVRAETLFGLKPVWRGQVRVNVSDPSRTVIDMLVDPVLGGGLRGTVDVLRTYLGSNEFKKMPQLLSYADQLDSGAVFKRLGFLLERFAPQQGDAIDFCRRRLSTGNAKLDPSLPSPRLVSLWRLWVPQGWEERSRS